MIMYPSVTAASLKKKHAQILQEVSVRTIQHRLQKGSENAMSPTAKKPLIIKVMMKKRILFCNIYKHWTIADWRKVMFCKESTSRLVLREYKLVRRPSGVSRYDSMYIIKTVKHPKSVMVWGDFSGDKGRGGVYFFPTNVTMRGDSYLMVLDHHMLPFWDIRRCNHFMQDGDPVHRSRVVKKWLKDNHVPVLRIRIRIILFWINKYQYKFCYNDI